MKNLADFASAELSNVADPAKSEAMAAYMKTSDPFYGVQKPARTPILREAKRRYPVEDAAGYRAAVLSLWNLPHREEKYLALAIASSYPQHITFEMLPLFRRLVPEGAWWDFVDDVAVRMVGKVWLDERSRTTAVMTEWIGDPDMWLRRSAIIGQLKHKADTDEAVLLSFCLGRAHEKEFFIRKAIGWALREDAKTSPAAVRKFVVEHRDSLSPLSVREATKHIGLSGARR